MMVLLLLASSAIVIMGVSLIGRVGRLEDDLAQTRRRLEHLEQRTRTSGSPDVEAGPTPAPQTAPHAQPRPVPPALPDPVATQQHRTSVPIPPEEPELPPLRWGQPPAAASASSPAKPPFVSSPTPSGPPPAPSFLQRQVRGQTIESFVAEHALSLVGGLFVIVAVVLFLTFAINEGWIGEGLRTLLAAAFGAALLAAGWWVASRLPREQVVGRAAGTLHGVLAGSGCLVLFLTCVVATRLYDVAPPAIGLLGAVAVGAVGVFCAIRWRSQDLAGFAMLGALSSPLLVGAPATAGTLGFLAVALAASAAVAVTESWPRLLVLSALVTGPQLTQWGMSTDADAWIVGLVTYTYWAMFAAALSARSLRERLDRLRHSDVLALFLADAVVVSTVTAWSVSADGVGALDRAVLLGVLACMHALLAAALLTRPALAPKLLGGFLVAAAAALAAAAVVDGTDGAAVTAAWAAEGAALWILWLYIRDRRTLIAAAATFVLSLGHLLAFEANPELLLNAQLDLSGFAIGMGAFLLATAAVAAVARRPRTSHPPLARVADGVLSLAGPYAASLLLVWGLSDDLSQHIAGTYDASAQQVLCLFLGIVAIVYMTCWSYARRAEYAYGSTVVAATIPIWILALQLQSGFALFAGGIGLSLAAAATAAWRRKWDVAVLGWWFLVLAAIHALIWNAPLGDLLQQGPDNVGEALAALLLVAAACGAARIAATRYDVPAELVGVVRPALDVLAAVFVTFAAGAAGLVAVGDGATRLEPLVPWLPWLTCAGIGAALAVRLQHGALAGWSSVTAAAATVAMVGIGAVHPVTGVGLALAHCVVFVAAAMRSGFDWEHPITRPAAASVMVGIVAAAVYALRETPPWDLVFGVEHVAVATATTLLAAVAWGTAAIAAHRISSTAADVAAAAPIAAAGALTLVLYALSTLAVGLFTSSPGEIEQDAQTALTIVWGVFGVAMLAAARLRQLRHVTLLRHGSYGLLGVAAAKVVLFDTSQLETPLRVLVFLAVGLLLLGGAWLEQRLSAAD